MYMLRAYCQWLRKIKGGILIYAQAEIPMVSGIKGETMLRDRSIYKHITMLYLYSMNNVNYIRDECL